MESAFGVDHGYQEIEKGLFSAMGGGLAGATRGLGSSLSRSGAGMRRNARPGVGGRMATPGKVNKPMQALGTGMGMAGGGLRKLSAGMAKRPGLTGGLAAGGAGAGVAGGGFMAGRMGGDNKKLSQYR